MRTTINKHDAEMDAMAALCDVATVISEPKPEKTKKEFNKAAAQKFWKENINEVVNNSYDPVPITPHKKHPLVKKWSKIDFTTADKIEQYSRSPHGIGIKTANTPAIDIDVLDAVVTKKLVTMIYEEIGSTGALLTRTGKKPKTLILSHLEGETFRKKKTARYTDPANKFDEAGAPIYHQLEILCKGQQFVACGVHPGTQEPYRWGKDKSPVNTRATELVKLSESVAEEIIRKAEQIFIGFGFENIESSSDSKIISANNNVDTSGLAPDVAAAMREAFGDETDALLAASCTDLALELETILPFDDVAYDKAIAALEFIDFSKFDYDAGIPIIAGLKRGSFDDKRILKALHNQAAKDNKRGKAGYDPDYINNTWNSISVVKAAKENEATLGVVYRTAIEHGWDEATYDATIVKKQISNGVALAFDIPISPGEFPHATKTEKGGYNRTVKCTIENVAHLLARYGITASFDVITKRYQFIGNGMPDDSRTGGAALAVNARLESLATLCGIPPANMQKMSNNISMDNPINPVVDYLSGLSWNSKDHIKKLAQCIGIEKADTPMRDEIIRLFIIEACAAADCAEQTPNKLAKAKFEYAPTLYSGQGIQKTKFWNELPPKPLRKYFADGLHLDPSNVDSVREATSNWMVELGELDSTFRAADISRLKAFVSKGIDTYRTPYDRVAGSYQRRTAFCGSVNQCDFLRDRTGSRRFWPLEVQSITLPSTAGINIEQVWAQGWALYMSGQQWWPTPKFEAILDKYRARFSMDDVHGIGIAMASKFMPLTLANKTKAGSKRMAVSEIYNVLFPNDLKPSRASLTAVSHYLQQHNKDAHGGADRKNHHGTNKWQMPPQI